MQAMILAAGMGRRLRNLTRENTKCMVEVAGRKIIDRTLEALGHTGISRLVVVAGYCGDALKEHLRRAGGDFSIIYVDNPQYESTNNIYSLFLAREELAVDDTLLLESDLVFDKELIKKILEMKESNVATVAPYEHWMDGTVVKIEEDHRITEFIEKKDFLYEEAGDYYKTVNIYKFSKGFLRNEYIPFLEAYIKAYGMNEYYEQVLSILMKPSHSRLYAYVLKEENWYEIDDEQDLNIANTIFADKKNQFHSYDGQFGGFWRFPKLKDFCYLVNPYYPPRKMTDEMKFFYETLLREYPSGARTQEMNAARMFGISSSRIVVGNGAAELIQAMGRILSGRMVVGVPAFNEYIRCFGNCELDVVESAAFDFRIPVSEYRRRLVNAEAVAVVSPDNPSGRMLSENEMFELLDYCNDNGRYCIVDESFADFADEEHRYTLLRDEVLEKYPGLVVIKSISKSYGVPGIRLGILATADNDLRERVRDELPIWNINSMGEYFLQIQGKYEDSYRSACNAIAARRSEMIRELSGNGKIRVYPSQANYIMCHLEGDMGAEELCNVLMGERGLLIKDLSGKDGVKGKNYIRIAVKDERENGILVDAINEYLK